MSTEEIMDVLAREIDSLRREYGVKDLSVFGSAARDELSSESDVDIVVDFDGPATIERYLDVKEHLEEVLDRDVDLVTRTALKPRLLDRIKGEMLDVA